MSLERRIAEERRREAVQRRLLRTALLRWGRAPTAEELGLIDVRIDVRDARERLHRFQVVGVEKRRDAVRFELASDTHLEDLRLAVRLTSGSLLPALEGDDPPIAVLSRLLSERLGARLRNPSLLGALEARSTPRAKDGWQVRRTSPLFDGPMYLDGAPARMGGLAGKALVRTTWVCEDMREVASRLPREDAEEMVRRLGENVEDDDRYEAVPEPSPPRGMMPT